MTEIPEHLLSRARAAAGRVRLEQNRISAQDVVCLNLGARANRWRRQHFGSDGASPEWVMAKLTEEIGEVARALVGIHEHRDGRGDIQHEIAQAIVVLCSLADAVSPNVDAIGNALREMNRLEGLRLDNSDTLGV